MKKRVMMLTAMVAVCGTLGRTETTPMQIKGQGGSLTVAAEGVSLVAATAACPMSKATGEPWWAIVLESAPGQADKNVLLESLNQSLPRMKSTREGITLSYGPLTSGQALYDVTLTLTFMARGDAFEINGEIDNKTKEWVVKSFTGPVFNGISADLSRTPLLMPSGFGWRINRLPDDLKKPVPWGRSGQHLTLGLTYPSARGTMQWFAFAGEKGGLYFGSHDPRFRAKVLSARYDLTRKTFAATFLHQIFVRPGKRVAIPPMVVMPYAGDWHVGARTYRAWADTAGQQIEKPAWAKTASGWVLTILKQQNGDIMWPYNSFDKLCDVADQRGWYSLRPARHACADALLCHKPWASRSVHVV